MRNGFDAEHGGRRVTSRCRSNTAAARQRLTFQAVTTLTLTETVNAIEALPPEYKMGTKMCRQAGSMPNLGRAWVAELGSAARP